MWIRVGLASVVLFCATGTLYCVEWGYGLEVADPSRLRVVIENMTSDASEIGLTKERILQKVELRLRQARIQPSEKGSPYLYVSVAVAGLGYSYSIGLQRIVTYSAGEEVYTTSGTTWSKKGTGTHGGSKDYVVQSVDGLLDYFLNEFLRANPPMRKK